MRKVKFHPNAEFEMNEAVEYYEAQQVNLGGRFLLTIQDAVNRILIDPFRYPYIEPGIRRCLVRTFPFGVVFKEKGEIIVVLAVMHLKRDPDYWKDRNK
jgi:plasmid stabilization system protein ParE